jgi:hypothetical protein
VEPKPVSYWITRGIAAAVVLGLMIASFFGTRKPDAQQQDFGAYYHAGRDVAAGLTPYNQDKAHGGPTGAFMYAPVFADYPFRLISTLPYLWAVRVFMAINWIASAMCVWLCLRTVPIGVDRFAVGCVALASAGTYLWADIHNGQVGTLLFLACLGWMTLHLAGRPFLGGLSLSFAVALKLYPALLVPYLVLRKDIRGLAGVAVGLAVLLISPALTVGPGRLVAVHREWLKFCVATQTDNQTVRVGNQSLLGVLGRLPWVTDSRERSDPAAVARLEKIYPFVVVIGTAPLYALVWFTRRRPPVVADVAILLLWMTLASPRCWTFNLCNEVLAATLLATRAIAGPGRTWPIVGLAGVLIAIGFPVNNLPYPKHGWAAWAFFMQNHHFDAAVLLMGVTIQCSRVDSNH